MKFAWRTKYSISEFIYVYLKFTGSEIIFLTLNIDVTKIVWGVIPFSFISLYIYRLKANLVVIRAMYFCDEYLKPKLVYFQYFCDNFLFL